MTDLTAFRPVKDALAILSTRGVYNEAPLHEYSGKLYARTKGGYIRLLAQQLTSAPNVTWRGVEGVMFIQEHDGLRILTDDDVRKHAKSRTKVAA